MDRWRRTAILGIATLALSAPLPWLSVTLNLSDIERGAQQYSILGVGTTVLPPTVSNSVYISIPYFASLWDVHYFALSALLFILALAFSAISVLTRKSGLLVFAAGCALAAVWYWFDDVKLLDEYLYVNNYLSSGMCYIGSEWVRCVSAEVGIGTYVAVVAGLVLLAGWLIETPVAKRKENIRPVQRLTAYGRHRIYDSKVSGFEQIRMHIPQTPDWHLGPWSSATRYLVNETVSRQRLTGMFCTVEFGEYSANPT